MSDLDKDAENHQSEDSAALEVTEQQISHRLATLLDAEGVRLIAIHTCGGAVNICSSSLVISIGADILGLFEVVCT